MPNYRTSQLDTACWAGTYKYLLDKTRVVQNKIIRIIVFCSIKRIIDFEYSKKDKQSKNLDTINEQKK